MRILVADDERDSVDTLVMLLADEGHDVRGVYRGADVLPAMEKFAPDWVLLDIAMPDMSGFELAQKIRRRYGESRPRMIAISGRYKKGSDRLLAELAGFNHHVPKPYEPDALLALLKN
jgi:CheY-like chemotaxis protein